MTSRLENRTAAAAIGQRLRAARDRAGVSNRDLAAAMGTDPASIYRYFSGVRLPPLTALPAVARVTGTTVEWLLTGQGPATPQVEDPADPVVSHEKVACTRGMEGHQDILIVRASGKAEVICPVGGRQPV